MPLISCRPTKQPLLLLLRSTIPTSLWISAIRNASSPYKSLQIYTQMHRQSVPFDSFAILYALKTCTHLHDLPLLRHLHAHISKLGFTSNVYIVSSLLHGYLNACFNDACALFDEMPDRTTVTWNTMIAGFSRSGDVNRARSVFDEMPLRNTASWSAMIAAYVNSGHWNKGLALFHKMLTDETLKPDQFTLCAILGGCGSRRMGTSGLVLGKSIHGFIMRNKWELSVELGTALVDMYAKCGFLKVAGAVFGMMQYTNVVSWTAMICGAARHGYVNDARTLFERMQNAGVRPNEFTFTGILNACMHAGLVEEGRKYFEMIKNHGMQPRIHHYCCMVDLLGKAGEVEEAYKVIMTMQPEPNMNVWGSFLYSCKVHDNFSMAERVIDRVINLLRPEKDGGVYTLIADLLVMGEKWDDAKRMRELIVSQNVRKARGSSFMSSSGLS